MMDHSQILEAAGAHWTNNRAKSTRESHLIMRNDHIAIFILPSRQEPRFKKYENLGTRSKRYREKTLEDVMGEIEMKPTDVLRWILRAHRKEVLEECARDSNNLKGALLKSNIDVPIDPKAAAALIVSNDITERDAQNMRSYFRAHIPPVKEIRKAKHEYLNRMPDIYILFKSSTLWHRYIVKNLKVDVPNSRNIECARLSFKEVITYQLTTLSTMGMWPEPPQCALTADFQEDQIAVVIISIDSGTGSTKLMAKFLREGGGQKTRDIMLLAQAHGVKEEFKTFERMFGPVASEIRDIEKNGLLLSGNTVRVIPLVCCDLKATWAMCGIPNAAFAHPCPLCAIHVSKLNQGFEETLQNPAGPRPPMLDLRGKPKSEYQLGNTYNLFHLRYTKTSDTYPNILIPILHIKLGFGKKLIEVFDNIMKMWAKDKIDGHRSKEHLAKCLAGIGVHRKGYYSGTISGGACTTLFLNLGSLCEDLFHTEISDWGNVVSSVRGISNLEDGLKKLSDIYWGQNGQEGFGYYLESQQTWTEEMFSNWTAICSQFIRVFRKSIMRPVISRNTNAEQSTAPEWRVPLQMPKLHLIISHSSETARTFGSLGAISEQAFENYQSISLKQRMAHSQNKCKGLQVAEDLIYGFLRNCPDVHEDLKKHEESLIAQKAGIKLRRYSA